VRQFPGARGRARRRRHQQWPCRGERLAR
jgi:hypothetical protein